MESTSDSVEATTSSGRSFSIHSKYRKMRTIVTVSSDNVGFLVSLDKLAKESSFFESLSSLRVSFEPASILVRRPG
jgi:hypothetical protein